MRNERGRVPASGLLKQGKSPPSIDFPFFVLSLWWNSGLGDLSTSDMFTL